MSANKYSTKKTVNFRNSSYETNCHFRSAVC